MEGKTGNDSWLFGVDLLKESVKEYPHTSRALKCWWVVRLSPCLWDVSSEKFGSSRALSQPLLPRDGSLSSPRCPQGLSSSKNRALIQLSLCLLRNPRSL